MHPLLPKVAAFAVLMAAVQPPVHAAEQIVLRNGFDMICDHRQSDGGRVKLFMDAAGENYIEVDASEIVSETPAPAPPAANPSEVAAPKPVEKAPELEQILAQAGKSHDLDVDLLASVIQAESGGRVRAVSRTGAQGLMQLMPGTAAQLGVADSFKPDENVKGGTAYLDSLLHRYGNNLAMALAAYNAGPAAVDRWHGIPPYRETRAYVARVIHEYNRRFTERLRAERSLVATAAAVR
jgi:soluble lytic murein transglycosylase-like protein